MKIDLDDALSIVKDSMTAGKVPAPTVKATLEKIAQMAKEIKEEEKGEAAPKTRKEFAVIAKDTDDPNILTGFVFQLDVGVEAHQLAAKISAAATEYNGTKKGKKRPAKTISATVETIANKFFKNVGLARKTKTAVYVIKTDDQLV